MASTWPWLRRPRSGLDSESLGKGSQHVALVSGTPASILGAPAPCFFLLTHSQLLSATHRGARFNLSLVSLSPAAPISCSSGVTSPKSC